MARFLRFALIPVCLLLWLSVNAADGKLLNITYIPAFYQGTIESFLSDIRTKTGVAISFSSASIDVNKQVKVKGNEQTINDVLTAILSDQKVDIVERRDKILIISKTAKKKSQSGNSHTIDGYVKEADSKEVLIGAIVYIPSLRAGTVTNSYGFYSLTLPEGSYNAVCSYTGFGADTFSLSLYKDNRHDILLSAQNKLDEVTITPEKKIKPDKIQVTPDDIEGKPAPLGENDIMRTLQTIAGVQTTVDGASQILVRGADPGQNLCLLDGVPVYYVDHFSGLTSIFNSEAIKSVDFYKGAFPAKYGGRLSSIVDVNTKDGSMDRIGGQFTMGLVKSSLNLEGPIVKDKASLMISARRTWVDGLWAPFTKDLRVNFYDLNVKANYIINKNNRLYISFYTGRDKLGVNIDNVMAGMKVGNKVGAIKWSKIVNPKLFVNSIITYSNYNFQQNDFSITEGTTTRQAGDEYIGQSVIRDGSIKLQAHWYPNNHHHIETGIQYGISKFRPVSVISGVSNLQFPFFSASVNDFNSNEIILYAEDEIKIGDRWLLRPGLHWANWFSSNHYNYSSLQPRMYAAFTPLSGHTIFGSFAQMGQFLHLVNNNTIGTPSDFWLPSSNRLEPEESYIGTAGYTASVKNIEYCVELYYKDIRHLTTYTSGKNLFDNTAYWEDKLTQGKGWSYGAEFSAFAKLGSFRASLAYTLSWTWRQFALLNQGKAYPYRYDRRHNLKLGLVYEPNKKFSALANWTFMSGEAITIPDQLYTSIDNNLLIDNYTNINSATYTYNYGDFNSYRLPSIHRLDVGVNFRKQKGKHVERTWSLGIFNAYGRRNIMFVDLVKINDTQFSLQGQGYLQFIPYVSYKLKF